MVSVILGFSLSRLVGVWVGGAVVVGGEDKGIAEMEGIGVFLDVFG